MDTDSVTQFISMMDVLGLFPLPKDRVGDDKFVAYGLYVNGEPFLCRKLTKAQYEFSYFLRTPAAWRLYLPKNWKSWSLWDLIKNKPICGSVRS